MENKEQDMAKELVVYFSVYGTAKIVAEEIAKQTGADITEIEPVVPYDSNRDHYNALARLAKKEHDEDQRPAIKNEIDIEGYDRIYTFSISMIFPGRPSSPSTPTWAQGTAALMIRSVSLSRRQKC